jgi:hypothetical protein
MKQVQIWVPQPATHSHVSPQVVPAGKSVQVAFGGPSNRPQIPVSGQLQVLVAGSHLHRAVPPSVVQAQ